MNTRNNKIRIQQSGKIGELVYSKPKLTHTKRGPESFVPKMAALAPTNLFIIICHQTIYECLVYEQTILWYASHFITSENDGYKGDRFSC
jgi:hypothetical protein